MRTHPEIQTYYDQTRFDYRTIWNNRDNLAVHFGFYDEYAGKHHDALNNMNRVLADWAGIQPGASVLDAGCGMGGACFWLAEHRDAKPTGISVVASQIDDCKKNAAVRGAGNVVFIQADYCKTPFPTATFDVVWACESVCHASDKLDFYREAFRLLKPGGRLVMAEYMRTARPVSEKGEALLAAWLRPWAIPDIDSGEEHRRNVQTAGFVQHELRDVTPNVRVSLRNLYSLCRKWLPAGYLLRFFRMVSRVRLNNVKASIRQYEALQEGAWFYGMLRAEKPQ